MALATLGVPTNRTDVTCDAIQAPAAQRCLFCYLTRFPDRLTCGAAASCRGWPPAAWSPAWRGLAAAPGRSMPGTAAAARATDSLPRRAAVPARCCAAPSSTW
ncbi:hypothetical protein CBM2609_B130065 [Cupriavidus taiwanensis]|nr:hypothetical protein CBM2609_B130065 [Cupriavidus taiwanensis]